MTAIKALQKELKQDPEYKKYSDEFDFAEKEFYKFIKKYNKSRSSFNKEDMLQDFLFRIINPLTKMKTQQQIDKLNN
jgi:hypothetical protein